MVKTNVVLDGLRADMVLTDVGAVRRLLEDVLSAIRLGFLVGVTLTVAAAVILFFWLAVTYLTGWSAFS